MTNTLRSLPCRAPDGTGAFFLALFSVGAFLTVNLMTAKASDWPQWRGIKRDGFSYETGWLTNWPPTEVWRMSVGDGMSSMSIDSERLYTMGHTTAGADSNLVYCFNATNGNLLWVSSYQCGVGSDDGTYPGPRCTPVVADNELYTWSQEGHLHCFDKLTGSNVWNTTVGTSKKPWYGFGGSPLVEGNLVIVSVGGAGMAFDRNPPHGIVWAYTTGKSGYASPIAYTDKNSQRILVFHSNDAVTGINATNGVVVWTYSWTGDDDLAGIQDPVIYENNVFVADGWRAGCALVPFGAGSVSHVWRNSNLQPKNGSSPVLMGNYVYGFHSTTKIRCLDVRDGTQKWAGTNTVTEGALVCADGKLIALDKGGKLFVINADPNAYVVLKPPFSIGGSGESYTPPVLSNGRLYCRRNTTLVCFRVGPEPEADNNSDGIPDSWQITHFTNVANCVATDDSDSDGVCNRDEYLAGTDPTNGLSFLTLTATESGSNLVFTVPTVKAEGTGYMARARFYSMESATGLAGSAWSPALDCMDVVGTNAPISYTNAPSSSAKFYRMKVRLE